MIYTTSRKSRLRRSSGDMEDEFEGQPEPVQEHEDVDVPAHVEAKVTGKRPKTAFLAFAQVSASSFSKDQRPAIQEANPGLRIVEVTKIVGEKWKSLDPAEREVGGVLLSALFC